MNTKFGLFHNRSLLVGEVGSPSIAAPVVDAPDVSITDIKLSEPPSYTKGQSIATREAYGFALVTGHKFKLRAKYHLTKNC